MKFRLEQAGNAGWTVYKDADAPGYMGELVGAFTNARDMLEFLDGAINGDAYKQVALDSIRAKLNGRSAAVAE